MGQRRRGREHALQMLFQLDLGGGVPDEVCREFWSTREAPAELRAFAERLVRGVVAERGQLDDEVSRTARHWKVERMAVVDRNVLRLAAWELIHEPRTPAAVVIDEAIEIAKKYGSGDSGAFINGILDAIRQRLETAQARPPAGGSAAR